MAEDVMDGDVYMIAVGEENRFCTIHNQSNWEGNLKIERKFGETFIRAAGSTARVTNAYGIDMRGCHGLHS